MKSIALIISCEHAVNTVPEAYTDLFAPHQELLISHRGIDFGSLDIAKALCTSFNCDFVQAQTTRLLIDCNRSLSHRQCFSEISTVLSVEDKTSVIQSYYLPFRQKIEQKIEQSIKLEKQVLHLSIHSFTPIFNEIERNIDLGLLYDPRRLSEKMLAQRWLKEIRKQDKTLRAYANRPYRGISDGFTTALRKRFANGDYTGIEVEINQFLAVNHQKLDYLTNLLGSSLEGLIKGNCAN
ncbi:MAG: N-formylglutamate amidohydrolase [Tatlockia sp.]|nr:N-formylglutamate amidohydrolase [Tatlockia sp.]